VALLAAAWWATPLGGVVEALIRAAAPLRARPFAAALATAAGFTAGSALLLPLTVLIFSAGLLFGPWLGFIHGIMACAVSASLAFWLGRVLTRDAVRFVAGARLNRVSARLLRRGVLPVARLRLVPIAPFAVTNLAAGAARVRFADFLLGTLFALAPGVLVTGILADAFAAAMRAPGAARTGALVAATGLVIAAGPLFRRLLGSPAAPGRRGGGSD
jgi:uncharacterized membrane protein YdjX (TVP38/TMEM64 family)